MDKQLLINDHRRLIMLPALGEHFGIARSVRLSVPLRSCLGHRHAGCLQLSHRRPPEMCGLWTRPRTDVDPPRFLIGSETICRRRTAIDGGHIVSPLPGRYLVIGCCSTSRLYVETKTVKIVTMFRVYSYMTVLSGTFRTKFLRHVF